MSNFHADKARALLNLAEIERQTLARAREEVRSGERMSLSYEEQVLHLLDASTFTAAAQVHATLATVNEVPAGEYHLHTEAPEPTEAPKDPNEPGQGEEDPTAAFFRGLDETLTLLHSISPVIHLIRGPRTVKDSPQA